MAWFVVDVESDGPCPGLYSMVSFGVVKLDRKLDTTCFGAMRPIDTNARWQQEALNVNGVTREEHLCYGSPQVAMDCLHNWLTLVTPAGERPTFVSDNPAFDWQFINYYFHYFGFKNQFGFSARRIGDLYAGMKGKASEASNWKHLRKTLHTHDPVDDAMGNAEALIAMADMGLKIPGL